MRPRKIANNPPCGGLGDVELFGQLNGAYSLIGQPPHFGDEFCGEFTGGIEFAGADEDRILIHRIIGTAQNAIPAFLPDTLERRRRRRPMLRGFGFPHLRPGFVGMGALTRDGKLDAGFGGRSEPLVTERESLKLFRRSFLSPVLGGYAISHRLGKITALPAAANIQQVISDRPVMRDPFHLAIEPDTAFKNMKNRSSSGGQKLSDPSIDGIGFPRPGRLDMISQSFMRLLPSNPDIANINSIWVAQGVNRRHVGIITNMSELLHAVLHGHFGRT